MAFNSVFAWFIGRRMSRIDFYRNKPIESQKSTLDYLNYNLSKTIYFQEHSDRFNECNLTNLQLQNYDSLKPYIDKTINGEENILWPGLTTWFAKTSGTSSHSKKLIPVTPDFLENNHYANGKDLLAQYYSLLPNRKLFNAKHLIIGGTGEINENNDGKFIGDLSAIIINNLPWWTEMRRTPAKEIALNGNWEHKLEHMAKAVINENVCIIAGMPSWTTILAKKILKISGKKSLKEVWPNLELYIHGGMNIGPYKRKLVDLFGSVKVNFFESYNASEGYFGMQDQLNSDEMLLMTHSNIFYEFIPMHEFDGIKSSTVLRLEHVETGIEYALVISNSSGLWRYIIGDTIKFTSIYPFRFKITGRTTNYINSFGEKLIEIQVEKAIEKAVEYFDIELSNYTVGPNFDNNSSVGNHQWLMEFEREPQNRIDFEKFVDEEIMKLNDDYKTKRNSGLNIGFPTFHYLKRGTFKTWLKKNNKLGGQHKIPRLSNNREIVEQILNLERE